MTEWINVIADVDLAEGAHALAEVDGVEVAVFKSAGRCYAVANVCSHDGGEIIGGAVENGELICPRHGARFCLKTGAATAPPAYEPIESFAVRITDGLVQVRTAE